MDVHYSPARSGVTAAPVARRSISSRELEVLRLLVEGHSNRAIGARLSISNRTVENHVAHIFAKLDLASRTAVVAWAVRHGVA